MTRGEAKIYLGLLANENLKSKHFSMKSLTMIALGKSLIHKSLKEHDAIMEELKVKVAISADGKQYVPRPVFVADYPTPEEQQKERVAAKKDYEEFIVESNKNLETEIEGLKMNFVTSDEMGKVMEGLTLDEGTALMNFLMVKDPEMIAS